MIRSLRSLRQTRAGSEGSTFYGSFTAFASVHGGANEHAYL